MLLAPPASMEDGLLDIIVLKGASRPDMLLRLLPGAFRGWHMRHPAVRHIRARSVAVQSDSPLLVQLDGEIPGRAPIEIEVCPRSLPVCLP